MATIFYVFIILTFVVIDTYYIEIKNIEIDKRIIWPVRAAVTIIFALIVKDFQVSEVLKYILFLAFLFYSLFDYSLNMICGKPFFYKGSNWIDRIIPSGLPDIAFKIIGVISSYIIYQKTFFACIKTGVFEHGFWSDIKECIHFMI